MEISYNVTDEFIDYFFSHSRALDRDTVCDDIIYNAFEKWVEEMVNNKEGQRVLDDIIDHL
jgi:hypothetical protein